ncbi:DUF4259 domain-containing protein [Streptomyces sp. NPDC057543]|uniref:DUF4259 domain-containing protein n=1 Tax=Streptomyces sp. NPDC057543 TaxID=3346163 RepID=UPI0036964771
MGTWDVGPFDNDTAADFGGNLDEAAAGEREGIVRSALTRVIDTAAHLEAPESEEAIAAAALVAAQCPGGDPTSGIRSTGDRLAPPPGDTGTPLFGVVSGGQYLEQLLPPGPDTIKGTHLALRGPGVLQTGHPPPLLHRHGILDGDPARDHFRCLLGQFLVGHLPGGSGRL